MKDGKLACLIVGLFAIGLLIGSPASAQTKPIDLYYSNVFPAPHKVCVTSVEWGKEIEKRTNGRVKVTMFAGGTLTPGDKCYDGVVKGLSHVGLSVFGYTSGKFPLTEVIDLPLGYKSGLAATRLINEYYKKFKPKEFDEVKVMYLHANGPNLVNTKKPVNKLEDLKGMKIRASGTVSKITQALGATPVAMPMPDTYDALSRGVVDGVICPIEAMEGWRLGEVVKYTTQGTGVANSLAMFVVMNKEKWNSIPPDIQQIIEKINEEWIDREGKVWDEIDKSGREFASQRGHKIITLAADEAPRWVKAVRPLLDDYVKSMKAKGLPGDEALKFCEERLKVLQQ
jgi:TRAP-type C4-dicarboxylate transport system substrate-binding protein